MWYKAYQYLLCKNFLPVNNVRYSQIQLKNKIVYISNKVHHIQQTYNVLMKFSLQHMYEPWVIDSVRDGSTMMAMCSLIYMTEHTYMCLHLLKLLIFGFLYFEYKYIILFPRRLCHKIASGGIIWQFLWVTVRLPGIKLNSNFICSEAKLLYILKNDMIFLKFWSHML